MPFHEM